MFYAIPLREYKEDLLNKQFESLYKLCRGETTYTDVPGEHYMLVGSREYSGVVSKLVGFEVPCSIVGRTCGKDPGLCMHIIPLAGYFLDDPYPSLSRRPFAVVIYFT